MNDSYFQYKILQCVCYNYYYCNRSYQILQTYFSFKYQEVWLQRLKISLTRFDPQTRFKNLFKTLTKKFVSNTGQYFLWLNCLETGRSKYFCLVFEIWSDLVTRQTYQQILTNYQQVLTWPRQDQPKTRLELSSTSFEVYFYMLQNLFNWWISAKVLIT